MGIAYLTGHLGANHAVAAVCVFFNVVRVQRCKVAGPPTARVKFCVGRKQRCGTANAAVYAGFVMIPVLSGEGALGAFFRVTSKLVGVSLFPPLGLCFHYFFCHGLGLRNS